MLDSSSFSGSRADRAKKVNSSSKIKIIFNFSQQKHIPVSFRSFLWLSWVLSTCTGVSSFLSQRVELCTALKTRNRRNMEGTGWLKIHNLNSFIIKIMLFLPPISLLQELVVCTVRRGRYENHNEMSERDREHNNSFKLPKWIKLLSPFLIWVELTWRQEMSKTALLQSLRAPAMLCLCGFCTSAPARNLYRFKLQRLLCCMCCCVLHAKN